jgi:DNA polymerase-1
VKPWVDAGSRQLNKLADDPGAPIDMSAWDASELEMRLAIKRVGDGVNPKRYAYAAIPADLRDSYCGRDAVSTSMLLDLQASQLAAEPELAAHYRGIVMPLSDAFVEMEAAGVAVSMANLGALRTFLVSEEARLLARLKAYGDFNPNTPKEVAELLYDKLGLPCLRTTPKGGRSTDVEALADLKHPAADDILEYRRAVKYRSTYADSYLAAVRPDGRVHPSILPDGTATGRPSCQDPNLFNVPTAKKELGTMVRDCFVARSGHVLVEADYSQIELRIAAMLSGDELMVDFFKRDVDFHLETAIMIAPLLGVDPSEVTKEHKLRGDAKTVNFATLYGDSPAGLAMKLKTTKQKAAALQNAILGKFRKLKAWIDMMLAEARRTGRCRTWWAGRNARIRPLIDIASPARELRETAERSSWNTPIQGTAAEFTNASIVELTRRLAGRRARLILTVYDSILAEVEEGWVEGYRAVARDVMLGWDSRGVPLEVEVKAGKTWGQMEVLKP